ncbi:MAG: MaoC/PaaZ C-terminal domain-containing protein [Pseudomonadota bacterium]
MNPLPAVQASLPKLCVAVTTKSIVMGATASRDWQPLHHDVVWAQSSGRLPNIIMNNYTQAGLISRYVTDWSGPAGRIGRLQFSMRSPLCPGDEVELSGTIQDIGRERDFIWVGIAIELAVGARIATTATVRLALPAAEEAPSVWHLRGEAWRP